MRSAVAGSTADWPVSQPKPGRKTPASSSGATGGRPTSLPRWKSSSPQPGAMWTMPVPVVAPTSFQATTRWASLAETSGAQVCRRTVSAMSSG